jgi:hypothetical protein
VLTIRLAPTGSSSGYFLSKLAGKVGHLTGWKEKIFGRRYIRQHVQEETAVKLLARRVGVA